MSRKIITVKELEKDVDESSKRKFDNPEIDNIIWSYKLKLSADRIAEYINKEYKKEYSGAQVRHQYNRLKKLQERTIT